LIQYHRDNFKVSFYDRRDDDGSLARYTFTTTYTQSLHVAGDVYDPRMYPYGCKTSKIMGQILVRRVSKEGQPPGVTLGEKYFSDWIGFGHTYLQNLPAGEYEVFI